MAGYPGVSRGIRGILVWMPRVNFTANLQRHVACPPCDVEGDTVKAALDRYFDQYPQARGYVLDERGAVRPHVTVFVAGAPVRDRATLSDAVTQDGEIYVMQALSGG